MSASAFDLVVCLLLIHHFHIHRRRAHHRRSISVPFWLRGVLGWSWTRKKLFFFSLSINSFIYLFCSFRSNIDWKNKIGIFMASRFGSNIKYYYLTWCVGIEVRGHWVHFYLWAIVPPPVAIGTVSVRSVGAFMLIFRARLLLVGNGNMYSRYVCVSMLAIAVSVHCSPITHPKTSNRFHFDWIPKPKYI